MPRGRLRLALALVLVAAVALGGLTFRLFVFPATDGPGRADAVVVFAGGDGERQAEGLRLVCFTPDPATTRGEARRFAELAGRQGWRSLVLVTSTYHVLRAGLLLERCYDGRVRRVGTPLRNDHSWETGKQLAGEWLALGAVLTLQRSC
jgi:hypothetical protein